jgi:hypothetical protein
MAAVARVFNVCSLRSACCWDGEIGRLSVEFHLFHPDNPSVWICHLVSNSLVPLCLLSLVLCARVPDAHVSCWSGHQSTHWLDVVLAAIFGWVA